MNGETKRPSVLLSTLIVLALSGVWGSLRLFVFHESIFPLTFVLPLLVCVWTRRRWQLWLMAGIYAVMTAVKIFRILPTHAASNWEQWCALVATLLNIVIGAVIVEAIISQRDRLLRQNAKVLSQNSELEALSEELTQQNEEIKAQAEELAQQNEEIESQTEELERQNQEMQEANSRLSSREGMLQAILESAQSGGGGEEALEGVCRRAMQIIGFPVEALAVLELESDEYLQLRAHARVETQPPLREQWPLEHSLARVVLKENRTAYVDDLRQRRDLAAPFAPEGPVRSLLVTPLRIGGQQAGVLAAISRDATHWMRDQFRLIEWVAGQCALILEGMRWQSQLIERAAEVEAANQAKDQFLAMLSHELRTPLTPVLVAAGGLENDDRLPADAREDVAMIRRNATVQSRLIDDLLDLTRVGRGKLELQRRPLRIVDVIQDASSIVAGDLDAKEQTLTLQLDVPREAALEGDGARLQQVFWNLLKNAIKFSPPKGRIALSGHVVSHPTGQRVRIEVADQGKGIDTADLLRIFEPFEQSAGSRSGSGGGLGLGLAIAKTVVELHGGTIQAHSDGPGEGATFTVELPLNDSPLQPQAQAGGDAAAADGPDDAKSPLRILLVEDHKDTGRLISRLLRGYGFEVEHAPDVSAAVKLFTDSPFDLLVSDLGLPDGTGLDVMRQLQAMHGHIPGICMSGYGMEADREATREAGFSEHLTKPIDVRQLQAAIERVTVSGRGPRQI